MNECSITRRRDACLTDSSLRAMLVRARRGTARPFATGPAGAHRAGRPGATERQRSGTATGKLGRRPAAAPLLRATARPGGARLGTAGPPPGQPPGHPRRSRKRLGNGSVAQWPSGKRERETEEEAGGESPSVKPTQTCRQPAGPTRWANPLGQPRWPPLPFGRPAETRRSYRSHERPCPPVACGLPARCRRGAAPNKER